jgi:hypothetical protein
MIAIDNVSGRYTVRLIIFQDKELGVGGAEPFSQEFMILRTRDNQKMKFVIADLISYDEGNVISGNNAYTQKRRLKTRKLIYEDGITLDPTQYDDQEGYYVV